MKLIIDIPDRTYDFIMGLNQHTFGSKYAYKDVQSDIVKAVKESKPYNPTGDLISREALKAKMKEADAEAIDYEMLVAMYEKLVDDAPAVEPERPQGEWLSQGYGYFCSICHIYHENSNFCPNCGAQMLKGGAE